MGTPSIYDIIKIYINISKQKNDFFLHKMASYVNKYFLAGVKCVALSTQKCKKHKNVKKI